MATYEAIEAEYTKGFERGREKQLEFGSLREFEEEVESAEDSYYHQAPGPVKSWLAGYLDGLLA